jgi:hypothetical protein
MSTDLDVEPVAKRTGDRALERPGADDALVGTEGPGHRKRRADVAHSLVPVS